MKSALVIALLLLSACGKSPVANGIPLKCGFTTSFAQICNTVFWSDGEGIFVPNGFTSEDKIDCGHVITGTITNGSCTVNVTNGIPKLAQ